MTLYCNCVVYSAGGGQSTFHGSAVCSLCRCNDSLLWRVPLEVAVQGSTGPPACLEDRVSLVLAKQGNTTSLLALIGQLT